MSYSFLLQSHLAMEGNMHSKRTHTPPIVLLLASLCLALFTLSCEEDSKGTRGFGEYCSSDSECGGGLSCREWPSGGVFFCTKSCSEYADHCDELDPAAYCATALSICGASCSGGVSCPGDLSCHTTADVCY
jgi:hypothetical protein